MRRDLSWKWMVGGVLAFFGLIVLCNLLYVGAAAGIIAFVAKAILGN